MRIGMFEPGGPACNEYALVERERLSAEARNARWGEVLSRLLAALGHRAVAVDAWRAGEHSHSKVRALWLARRRAAAGWSVQWDESLAIATKIVEAPIPHFPLESNVAPWPGSTLILTRDAGSHERWARSDRDFGALLAEDSWRFADSCSRWAVGTDAALVVRQRDQRGHPGIAIWSKETIPLLETIPLEWRGEMFSGSRWRLVWDEMPP